MTSSLYNHKTIQMKKKSLSAAESVIRGQKKLAFCIYLQQWLPVFMSCDYLLLFLFKANKNNYIFQLYTISLLI